MITIDARNMTCPKPVIEAKKALESIQEGSIRVEVDNEVAKNNVQKLATSLSYPSETGELENGCFFIQITKDNKGIQNQSEKTEGDVIVFTKALLGQGNDELGKVLMKGFIYTLNEATNLPKALIFLNGGVELTTEGSASIEDLKKLQERGVELISCGTCLDYYHAKEKLLVGEIGNMYSIVEKMLGENKVVTI